MKFHIHYLINSILTMTIAVLVFSSQIQRQITNWWQATENASQWVLDKKSNPFSESSPPRISISFPSHEESNL